MSKVKTTSGTKNGMDRRKNIFIFIFCIENIKNNLNKYNEAFRDSLISSGDVSELLRNYLYEITCRKIHTQLFLHFFFTFRFYDII